jgi:hypothetical protein
MTNRPATMPKTNIQIGSGRYGKPLAKLAAIATVVAATNVHMTLAMGAINALFFKMIIALPPEK